MESSFLVAQGHQPLFLKASLANRHGLIAGATGTGKTVTLKVLAEGFSRIGVPCFLADVKGDLAGTSQAGVLSDKFKERCQKIGLPGVPLEAFPTVFWDVFGEQGIPVRITVSDLGPQLISRLLNLNETQAGVMAIIFKAADDNGLLLLDIKDLGSVTTFVGENAQKFTLEYGNVSQASIGAIRRAILHLSEEGGDHLFGEPALTIDDLLQTDEHGKGVINILAADKLMQYPLCYSTFLLWLLSELFEKLPEVGDLEKPKFVLFFDEAHLIFDDAPKQLLDKIEQVIRLIRSKGVGVFFISQSPLDIAPTVLGQLGNRVQHALRAFTPKDQKAVRAAADTFRSDKTIDVRAVLTELEIGEALVSFLDDNGSPEVAQRAFIIPPSSRLGPITSDERTTICKKSDLYSHYRETIDRESAYERIKTRAERSVSEQPATTTIATTTSPAGVDSQPKGRQGPLEAFAVSTARSIGSYVGRQLVRGIMGSLLGGTTTRSRR